MKTIQTFVLLILLFAVKIYGQDDDIAKKIDIEAKTAEFEALALAVISDINPEGAQETSVPDKEVDSSDNSAKTEEVPTTVSNIQEISSTTNKIETPNSESSVDSSPIVDEGTPVSVTESEIQEVSESSPIVDEGTSLSVTESEVQEVSESSPIVDEGTSLSVTESEVQEISRSTLEEQQPVETIVCICDCGADSNQPQKCEESSTESIPDSIPVEDDKSETIEAATKSPTITGEDEVSLTENAQGTGNSEPSETNNHSTTEAQGPENSENNIQSTSAVIEDSASPSKEAQSPEKSETNSQSTSAVVEESASPSTEAQSPENSETTSPESTSVVVEDSNSQSATDPEVNGNSETAETNNQSKSATVEVFSSLSTTAPDSESNSATTSTQLPETNDQTSSNPEQPTSNDPIETSSSTNNACSEVGDFPDPTNCRQYISCSENESNLLSQELQCPERSAFSPILRRCTRDVSPCLDEEPMCLKAGSLSNPNGENSSYYWCVPSLLGGFHKYHIQCSPNEVFTPLLGRCWVQSPQLDLVNLRPNDRDLVRTELKFMKKELKLKAKEEKLRRKMEEKAKALAEKLAAKELKKQKGVIVRKVDDDDDDSDDEEDKD